MNGRHLLCRPHSRVEQLAQEELRQHSQRLREEKKTLFPLLSKHEVGPYVQRVMSFIKGEQRTPRSWCRDRGILEAEKKSHWRIFWKALRRTKMTEKPRCIIKPSTFWFFPVAGKIKALVKFMTQLRQEVSSFNPGSESAPEERSEIPSKSQPGSTLLLMTDVVASWRVKKDLHYVNKSLMLPSFVLKPKFSEAVTELTVDQQPLFRQRIVSMRNGEEKSVNETKIRIMQYMNN